MLPASRKVNATFRESATQCIKRDLLACRYHVLETLNKGHSAKIEQYMARKFFIQGGLITTQVKQAVSKRRQAGVSINDTVSYHPKLAVVRELTPIVLLIFHVPWTRCMLQKPPGEDCRLQGRRTPVKNGLLCLVICGPLNVVQARSGGGDAVRRHGADHP